MSGVLNVLLGAGEGKLLLSTTNITLTSGYVAVPAPATVFDVKWYGLRGLYGVYGPIGSVSPSSIDGFTIYEIVEQLSFSSQDASWTGLTGRYVSLTIGSGRLSQDSFTTLSTSTGGNLATSSATFYKRSTECEWVWTVITGIDDGSADYLGSGIVTITQ